MSNVVSWIRVPLRPGTRDAALESLEAELRAVQEEPGTLLYVVHTSDTDPDAIYFYEMYEDEEAVEVHRASSAFQHVGDALTPLLDGAPESLQLAAFGGKGF